MCVYLYQRECVFVRTLVLQNRVFVYVCMHDYQRLCIRVYVCVCVAVDCEYVGEEKSQGGNSHFYRLRQRGLDSFGAAVAARPGVCDYIVSYLFSLCFETSTT